MDITAHGRLRNAVRRKPDIGAWHLEVTFCALRRRVFCVPRVPGTLTSQFLRAGAAQKLRIQGARHLQYAIFVTRRRPGRRKINTHDEGAATLRMLNIREFRNALERAMRSTNGDRLEPADFPLVAPTAASVDLGFELRRTA